MNQRFEIDQVIYYPDIKQICSIVNIEQFFINDKECHFLDLKIFSKESESKNILYKQVPDSLCISILDLRLFDILKDIQNLEIELSKTKSLLKQFETYLKTVSESGIDFYRPNSRNWRNQLIFKSEFESEFESETNQGTLEVIKIIKDTQPDSSIFLKGHCYKLFKILQQIFPSAVPYYNSDHVITKIGERFYDITGEVEQREYQPLIEKQIIEEYEK